MKRIRDTIVVKTGSHCLHSGLCALRKTGINQSLKHTQLLTMTSAMKEKYHHTSYAATSPMNCGQTERGKARHTLYSM